MTDTENHDSGSIDRVYGRALADVSLRVDKPRRWFWPFYEQAAFAEQAPVVGRVMLCVLLTLGYLLAASHETHNPLEHIETGMLAVMLGVSLGLLQFAGIRLRMLLGMLALRSRRHDPHREAGGGADHRDDVLHPELEHLVRRRLGSQRMLIVGGGFAVVNCLFGLGFGVPAPPDMPGPIIAFVGYALIGLTCGMAANGIFAVVDLTNRYAEIADVKYDFTHPDGCGGLAPVGSAIAHFSLVTLGMGVLIAFYITHSEWSRQDDPRVQIAISAWSGFPFLLSALVLVAPMSIFRRLAIAYKLEQDGAISSKLASLQAMLEPGPSGNGPDHAPNHDASDRPESGPQSHPEAEAILKTIERLREDRAKLSAMRTWPYPLSAQIAYVVGLLPAALAAVENVQQIVEIVSPAAAAAASAAGAQ
ncbi:MAG: hypothetical protein AAFR96_01920 [Planctomycetota bacterium]